MKSSTVRFVSAVILLSGLRLSLLAGPITVSEPVMVDPSVFRFPEEQRGPVTYYEGGASCSGQTCNLVAMRSRPIGSYEMFRSWLLVRTDVAGNLIDSVPKPLFANASSPLERNFDLYDILWSPPYFYLVGREIVNFDQDSDSLSYLRVAEDLSIVDDLPIRFMPATSAFYLDFSISDNLLWTVYDRHEVKCHFFDVSGGSTAGDSIVWSDVNARHLSSMAKEGLYLTFLTDGQSDTLSNYYITTDGGTTDMGRAVVGLAGSGSQFNTFSMLPYGTDSAVACFFDSSTTGTYVLHYYFVSPFDGATDREVHEIEVPFLPGETGTREAYMFMHGTNLAAVTMYVRYDPEYSGYYLFDLKGDSLIQALKMDGVDPDTYLNGGAPIHGADKYFYYYRYHDTYWQYSFEFDDPLSTLAEENILYAAQEQRYPTLLLDDGGLLLYFQQTDSTESRLRAFRPGTPPLFEATPLGDFLEEGYSPYLPWLRSVGDRKVLLWHEDTTHYSSGDYGYIYFKQHIVLFDGDIPSEAELVNQQTIYTRPGFLSVPGRGYYCPDFAVIDSLAYFNLVGRQFGNYLANNYLYHLMSLDLTTGRLTGAVTSFECNGRSPLIWYGDSLLTVRSFRECQQSGNNICYDWEAGYEFGILYDGVTFDPRPPLATYTRHFGFGADDDLPDHVYSTVIDGEPVISFCYSAQLVHYNAELQQVEDIVWLNGYTPEDIHDCDIIPLSTSRANIAVVLGDRHVLNRILAFDKKWNFAGSAPLPLKGSPIEFSDFVYYPECDCIVFAYSAYVPDEYTAPRVFMQSISFDVFTGIEDGELSSLPDSYKLEQNYPNPFNSATSIVYALPAKSHVTITVFNVLGQEVARLVDQEQIAGVHTATWNGCDASGNPVSTGVYLYRLTAGDFTEARKMLLLK